MDIENFYDTMDGVEEGGKAPFHLNKLVKAGLVIHEFENAPRDARYKLWHYRDARFPKESLVSAGCFVTSWKLFMIRYYLGLPEGFDKLNSTYGDFKFQTVLEYGEPEYQFVFRGEMYSRYFKPDITHPTSALPLGTPMFGLDPVLYSYKKFGEMIHDIMAYLMVFHDRKCIELPQEFSKSRFCSWKQHFKYEEFKKGD